MRKKYDYRFTPHAVKHCRSETSPPPRQLDAVTMRQWSMSPAVLVSSVLCAVLVVSVSGQAFIERQAVVVSPQHGAPVCGGVGPWYGVAGSGQSPPPAPHSTHDYFDRLSARPDRIYSYSMRDQDQIDRYRPGRAPGPDPPTYDAAMDAMRIRVGANKGSIAIRDQVHFPIDATPGDTFLLTWDTWFSPEFFTEKAGNWETQKWVQIQVNEPGEDRWWEHRMRYLHALALPDVGGYDARLYRAPVGNMTDQHPILPMASDFMVRASAWTRHWMLIEPDGSDYEVTVWVADEHRDPVIVFDHVDVTWPDTNLNSFEVEYNSSQSRTGGIMDSYMRNLVMLRNPGDVTTLLIRPVGLHEQD